MMESRLSKNRTKRRIKKNKNLREGNCRLVQIGN